MKNNITPYAVVKAGVLEGKETGDIITTAVKKFPKHNRRKLKLEVYSLASRFRQKHKRTRRTAVAA